MKSVDGKKIAPIKKYTTLSRGLVLWFLSLSLLPLSLVSWLGYQSTNSSLREAAVNSLVQSSNESIKFIQNWYEYRLLDLEHQSKIQRNVQLLSSLLDGFSESQQKLTDYVKTDDWALRAMTLQRDLVNLSKQYKYIYDLFLIDTKGNIVYSVRREDDLGTNLFTGVYANTPFAKSVKKTSQTGQVSFSDLDRYTPSSHLISGFLSAPLEDVSGNKVGIFSIQIRVEKFVNSLKKVSNNDSSMTHYLVGEDGKLRTPIYGNEEEVLSRVINTRQFELWKNVHSGQEEQQGNQGEKVFQYTGPDNRNVIGLHQMINLSGVKWMLISEIDEVEAFEPATLFAKFISVMLFVTFIFVIFLAVFQARRISKPITILAKVFENIAAGKPGQRVDISSNNEIGRLAESFNKMLELRESYEETLRLRRDESLHALAELAEQKYALDQHAIVAITDVGGTITFVNHKFTEISGYSSKELIGQNHRMLNSGYHEKAFFEQMYQTIAGGRVWHAEICNKAKSGRLYWVDTTIVPFMDTKGKPKSYVAIRADITERKKAEAELYEAKELAEAAVKAKGEFLASMSHEIRTPMNGILGMLSLLQKTELDEKQEHRVTVAQNSAKALLTLINDILDFSKVDAGKLEIENIDFDLREMMGDFSEALGYQAQTKGLEIIMDVSGIKYSRVKGDPGRVRQIFTNLIGNAIKFTGEGEIVIRASLHPDEGNRLRFECSVCDTGIGIPLDKQSNLFESFNQVDASTTRKYGGTGLGLSIAKNLCQLMGGNLTVESKEGEGSCFNVKVFFDKSERSKKVLPKANISSLNVLVVDDNATNRKVLSDQLRHWGANVVEAKSGAEALELCEARIKQAEQPFFDIAFVDMEMPGMDGKQLGKKITAQKAFNSLRMVMMTPLGFNGNMSQLTELGFATYIYKPVTTSDLFDALAVMDSSRVLLGDGGTPVANTDVSALLEKGNVTADSWPQDTRILLVEDNQVNQMVAVSTLEMMGVSADVAGNGIEALQALKSAPSDAPYTMVFMDCQMPEMDGFEASKKIRAGEAGARNIDVPIVALTANAMKEDKDRCIAAGMSDYLSKPFEEKQLKEKLARWLLIN